MKYATIFIILATFALLGGITAEDIRFLLDKEQHQILEKFASEIEAMQDSDPETVLDYAQRTANTALALRCHLKLALKNHSLEDALQYLRLGDIVPIDSLMFEQSLLDLMGEFYLGEDRLVLNYYLYGKPDEEYMDDILRLDRYNPVIEAQAKAWIDEISVERSDSLALALTDRFDASFPLSKWSQVAYYYRLYHLSQQGDYGELTRQIWDRGAKDPVFAYISALYLMSPSLRKELAIVGEKPVLDHALDLLDVAQDLSCEGREYQVLYDVYDYGHWQNRLALTRAKIGFYRLIDRLGLYGDEEDLVGLLHKPTQQFNQLLRDIESIGFENNDSGEIAELEYWKGRIQALYSKPQFLTIAAKSTIRCLIEGAPRKKYDEMAFRLLEQLHFRLKVKSDLYAWARGLMKYRGIVFEEHPFPDRRYSRIAIGDYDNDGYNDLLFNGSALFRNDQGTIITDVSAEAIASELYANGGLWADFNLDGLLDFVAISHRDDGMGEALMKNMDQIRFVKVNERAGDIDDRSPTEGAAWIDIDRGGYPSLYTANYEKWQQQSGFPDCFWYNMEGYFNDDSISRGFRLPYYTTAPGLAGRGVAPADFDNDGLQEILVTNYRLNRNFLWKQSDSLFIDLAALYGVSGTYKNGYYGHSIGADWGDYDNDGDLDLFIANLAHPRYIEISDISMLLRNDGLTHRVVEADTLYYWQFTDVTKSAGIAYDELHSDPLFFDADNDGWLDLFVTSVYENDRSYLYKNNGNGTFTDITWLSNARIYNGWGNASGDLDRDGLPDLVVGSGNGTKILLNRTKTKNRSITVKPVWKSGEVLLLDDWRKYLNFPNSPAFGTRVKLTLKTPRGKQMELIRELRSAKGTTSQNAQELHFGLGLNKLLNMELVDYAKAKD